jgi:hypothetical protein
MESNSVPVLKTLTLFISCIAKYARNAKRAAVGYRAVRGTAKGIEESPAIRKSRQFDESGTGGARSWNKYRRRKSQKQCVNWDRHGGRRVLRIWIKLGGALGEGHSWLSRKRV